MIGIDTKRGNERSRSADAKQGWSKAVFPSPRGMVLTFFGPVFWLAVILIRAFPWHTQWHWRTRLAYSSGGCAGMAANAASPASRLTLNIEMNKRTRIGILLGITPSSMKNYFTLKHRPCFWQCRIIRKCFHALQMLPVGNTILGPLFLHRYTECKRMGNLK